MATPIYWCASHWDPIDGDAEANSVTAQAQLINKAFNDSAIMTVVGNSATQAQMEAEMAAQAPLCCYFGDDAVDEIHSAVGGTP